MLLRSWTTQPAATSCWSIRARGRCSACNWSPPVTWQRPPGLLVRRRESLTSGMPGGSPLGVVDPRGVPLQRPVTTGHPATVAAVAAADRIRATQRHV